MSITGGTCQYVFDPTDFERRGDDHNECQNGNAAFNWSNPETWSGGRDNECRVDEAVLNEDGVWTCPHDAEGDDDRCIFHRPLAEKDETAVLDAFVAAVKSRDEADTATDDQTGQFLGAAFGRLDPRGAERLQRVSGNLRLSYATISGSVDFSEVVFEGSVSFVGATFQSPQSDADTATEASFEGATFKSETTFEDAAFELPTTFTGATFEARASFAGVHSEEMLGFDSAVFEDVSRFREAVFEKLVSFEHATFSERADFFESTFADAHVPDEPYAIEPAAWFGGATFERGAELSCSTFEVQADFALATFGENADFHQTTFGAEADFMSATFGSDADFLGCEFVAAVSFRKATFGGTAGFQGVDLTGQQFHGADLTDADFGDATLCRADLESTLLSRARLTGADLRGATLSGAVIGDVHVDEDTRFLGRPGDDTRSPHTIAAIRASHPCVYDPAYGDDGHADTDTAKSVYRTLEDLGRRTGRSRLQARCFVRRQDLQKDGYWDDATAADVTAEERLVAGARWGRSAVARAMLLYGESPWRVIGYSFVTVIGFALLYPLGGWMRPEGGEPVTYDGLASVAEFGNSLYYSTLTFTALGFGDFQPVGFGRVLTTIETSFGAVLLALLVFILGRRAAR